MKQQRLGRLRILCDDLVDCRDGLVDLAAESGQTGLAQLRSHIGRITGECRGKGSACIVELAHAATAPVRPRRAAPPRPSARRASVCRTPQPPCRLRRCRASPGRSTARRPTAAGHTRLPCGTPSPPSPDHRCQGGLAQQQPRLAVVGLLLDGVLELDDRGRMIALGLVLARGTDQVAGAFVAAGRQRGTQRGGQHEPSQHFRH